MRDWRRPGLRLGAVLLALTLVAPGEGRAGACEDCCQLPCVEAAIHTAEGMRELYKKMKGEKGLSQDGYKARVDAERARLGVVRHAALKDQPQCAFKLPAADDYAGNRRLYSVGWGTREVDGGVAFTIFVHTDMESCSLNERQMSLFKELVPCSELGEAVAVHERTHLEQCKGKKGQKHSTSLQASQEESAHEAELAYLRRLRDSLQKQCQRRSCRKQGPSDEDAQKLGRSLEQLRKHQGKAGK